MTLDDLSTTFAALADPTRRAILARLARSDASVGELAEPFAMSLPAISKHLKVLERAALITREKDAQWRRCRLRPEGFRTAAVWLAEYQRFWSESFERLDRFLEEEAASRPAPMKEADHDEARDEDR
jgi:DNA-binding transcriptional ArsR family regulator